jgi:hypothetical protein
MARADGPPLLAGETPADWWAGELRRAAWWVRNTTHGDRGRHRQAVVRFVETLRAALAAIPAEDCAPILRAVARGLVKRVDVELDL